MRIDIVGSVVAFLFVSVVSVNAVMLTQAARSYTGMLDTHPYSKGLAYDVEQNQRILFRQSRWKVTLQSSPAQVQIRSADGSPFTDATVVLRAIRPNAAGMDRQLALLENAAGSYGSHENLDEGRWIIDLTVSHDGIIRRSTRQVELAGSTPVELSAGADSRRDDHGEVK
jgi:nitrogen fixation protein FixH